LKKVWPLSLLALRSAVGHLSLEREPKPNRDSPSGFLPSCPHINFLSDDSTPKFLDSKLYSKHIKPKKFHEIEIMAQVYIYFFFGDWPNFNLFILPQVTQNSAAQVGCEYIVDIGSGLGHLGRILALHHGLRVCCLEEQICLTEKARLGLFLILLKIDIFL